MSPKSRSTRIGKGRAGTKVAGDRKLWLWEGRTATDLPPECGSLGSAAALQEALYILGLSQPPLPLVLSAAGSAVP